jgi:tryptophan-rich sensory protein
MAMLDAGRDRVEELLNARDRSLGHVLAGAAVCLGAAALSAVIAAKRSPTKANPKLEHEYDRLEKADFEPPKSAYSVVWPALFSVTTLSALRIWNAPSGPDRTKALGLWAALQGMNALWMALSPKHRATTVATALLTAVVTFAYARQAGKVDEKSAGMIAPYAGWVSFANLLSAEVWRKNRPKGVTIH